VQSKVNAALLQHKEELAAAMAKEIAKY